MEEIFLLESARYESYYLQTPDKSFSILPHVNFWFSAQKMIKKKPPALLQITTFRPSQCVPMRMDHYLELITVDDVLDIIEEEHTEDLLKLAGTEDQDTVGASVFTAVKSRLPWLAAS